jgi:putative ABC transport system permease protein
MSLWTRIQNVLRGGNRLNGEIDEELESHINEAVAQGRDPSEARRAFGSPLQTREHSRDLRLVTWLDSLRSDTVFGWRQLVKNKVTSAAAVLSLALAIGACTSAFRLIDAILLRPLPVANADELYLVDRYGTGDDGKPAHSDGWAYPSFERMRDAVKDDAELIAASYVERADITYASDEEMEKAQLQYVSGSMFPSFGLHPALGRLFDGREDLKPGASPYAVLSYDYWTRRFGRDRSVIGRSLHVKNGIYEIIGVAPETFSGTETGAFTDLFVPAMMHPAATKSDWTWHRTLAHIKPGRAIEPIRAKLNAASHGFEEERAKGFMGMTKESIEKYLDQTVRLNPASAGASDLQQDYRRALLALGALVALVLLIACANVANLMTAQAASRAREMALRVSIGAGRWRLIQLVLVESGWISFLAATAGGFFAWWSAPFVVSLINPPDNPARLYLPWDWRGFGLALTLAVTIIFGLVPALRASAVRPSSALKGGDDSHSRRRLMHVLIAAQVAFCFVVLFVSGLFTASFKKLSNKPTGFSTDRILTVETAAQAPQPPLVWEQVSERLREVPGVETVAYTSGALLAGSAWNKFISINGAPPSPVLAYLLNISPGWIGAMKLHLIDGRDFRVNEPTSQIAIVNQTFVKQFFNGENALRRTFETSEDGKRVSTEIVGIVSDAAYKSLREPILPVAYVPYLPGVSAAESNVRRRMATFIVRTASANPVALAPALRQEVVRARPDFRVTGVRTQLEINQAQTVRERLLAMLALFFAVVALLLAGIGLYGVLDYSVLQRRREFGIRIAIGAPAVNIARLVSLEVFGVVIAGATAGLALGVASAGYVDSLFYDVKATDFTILAIPSVTLLVVALLAALRPVIHALRIDPVVMLRSE